MPQVIQSRQLATPGKDIMEGAHNLLSTLSYIDKKFKVEGKTGGFVASYDMVNSFRLGGRCLHGEGDESDELSQQVLRMVQDASQGCNNSASPRQWQALSPY